MNRFLILILSLSLFACGTREEDPLFNENSPNACDAFTKISKYALTIHVNKDESDFESLRLSSSKKFAKALNYNDSTINIANCADIEAYIAANPKMTKMEVYSKALNYFMQALDPHSMYIPQSNATEVKNQERNIAFGMGAEAKYVHRAIKYTMPLDSIMIDYVYPDTPAYGKLKPNDEIVSINGEEIHGKTYVDLAQVIVKNKGELEIKIKNKDEPMKIGQSQFQKPLLYSKSIQKDGHRYYIIRIQRFIAGVSSALKAELVALKEKSPDGIIIDLRGNPGGLVREGVAMLNLLLSEKGEVFHTEGSNKPTDIAKEFRHQVYDVSGNAIYTGPLVVMVDSDTASIAEAVAGALFLKGRANVVGNETFGKGSVQVNQSVSQKNGFGGILITTVSLLYYPDEDTHQGIGIKLNQKLNDEICSNAMEKAKDLNMTSIFHEVDYGNIIRPHNKDDSNFITAAVESDEGIPMICDKVDYQACAETYAVKYLETITSQNSI